ncbi:unnamed protein product [Ectocarpus fasciculatus]
MKGGHCAEYPNVTCNSSSSCASAAYPAILRQRRAIAHEPHTSNISPWTSFFPPALHNKPPLLGKKCRLYSSRAFLAHMLLELHVGLQPLLQKSSDSSELLE